MFSIPVYHQPAYYQSYEDPYENLLRMRAAQIEAARAEAAQIAEARAQEHKRMQYLAYQQALRAELEAQARAEYEAQVLARAQLQAHAHALIARREEAQRKAIEAQKEQEHRELQRARQAQLEAQLQAQREAQLEAQRQEKAALEQHAMRIQAAREAAHQEAVRQEAARREVARQAAEAQAKAHAKAYADAQAERAARSQAQIPAQNKQLRFGSVEELLNFVARQNQRIDEPEFEVEEPVTPEPIRAQLCKSPEPALATQAAQPAEPASPARSPQAVQTQTQADEPQTPPAQNDSALSEKLSQLQQELVKQTGLVQAADRKLKDLQVAHSRTEAIYSALDSLQVPKSLRQQKHKLTRDAVALADSIDSLISRSSPRHHVTLEEVDEIGN